MAAARSERPAGAASTPWRSRRTRRAVSLGLAGAAWLGGAGRDGRAARAGAPPAAAEAEDFFQRWPYARSQDVLPFLEDRAAAGDPDGVLAALEEWGTHYPAYKLTRPKAAYLEGVARDAASRVADGAPFAVEVGTFFGYSAVHLARALGPAGELVCVEAKPDHAEVARAVLARAGYADRVTVVDGLAEKVLPSVASLAKGRRADIVFLDHCKECYLPDLKRMEDLGLVRGGSVVVADNVLYPGAPGWLEYVGQDGGGRYDTRLHEEAFEYERAWDPSWTPKKDALSVSVLLP